MNRKHSFTIDYIRAISAILIVMYHYTYRYNENEYIINTDSTIDYPLQISWGVGAVSTFFILSGYLFAKNINIFNVGGEFKLLKNRLQRLYPTYWVSMTLTTLVLLLLFPATKVSLSEFLVNLTMMASTFKVRFIDGAYWTMGYEVKFAIILSLILFIKKLKYRNIVLLAWIVMSIISSFWSENDNSIWKVTRVCLITDWIQTFISGICIYQIRKTGTHKRFYCLLWVLCLINQLLWIQSIASLSFFLITSFLLLYLSYVDSIITNSILTKIAVFVASISYPLYLIHQMIGFAIIKMLVNNGFTNELWLFIPFIIIVLFSYLIHRYIELPSSKKSFKYFPNILK